MGVLIHAEKMLLAGHSGMVEGKTLHAFFTHKKAETILPKSTWLLKEILADPGDGSGTFEKVNSNRYIEFRKDGAVYSNGNLCSMSISSETSSVGECKEGNSILTVKGCDNQPLEIKYKENHTVMILSYPCKESCLAKYVRIE